MASEHSNFRRVFDGAPSPGGEGWGEGEGERNLKLVFLSHGQAASSALCSPAADAGHGKPGSFKIVSLLVGMPMSAAVEFNREARFLAEKIQEVNPDGMPPAKFVGAESPVTQPTPDELFRPSRAFAQGAGTDDVRHGESVARERCEEKNSVNVRPHPGPLPQERENHSSRFGNADALDCTAVSSASDQKAAMFSLSSGERAGVRASVHTDIFWNGGRFRQTKWELKP